MALESFHSPTETSSESPAASPETDSKDKKTDKKKSALGSLTAHRLFEAPSESKKVERIESLFQKRKESAVKTGANAEEASSKSEKDAPEPPLETLSIDEAHDAVVQYTAAQKEALRDRLRQPKNETQAEDAADLALLETIDAKLEAAPDKSVDEVLDEAELEMVEGLQNVEAEPTSGEEENEVAENDDEAAVASTGGVVPPLSPPPTASGGAVPPMNHGSGGSPTGSAGGIPPYSSRGGIPPVGGSPGGWTAGYGGGFASGGFNPNAAPTPPQVVEVQDITAERTAMARGLLVGGFIGYLVGRRRGRIKTQKRLAPIQRKLEKQVTALHAAVAAREAMIRKAAAEKTRQPANVSPSEQVTAGAMLLEQTSRVVPTAERPLRRAASRERFSGGVIEAPAVILGAAAAIRSERTSEKAKPAVDFSKKIEAYSPHELNRAAEKIRIDGTTLKELGRAHNLDEKAMRRVVRSFVEGGNVKEALTREMVEKELQFERDPRFKKASAAGSGALAAAAVAGGALAAKTSSTGVARSKDDVSGGGVFSKRPELSEQALEALRKKQMTQLAGATAFVVIAIVIMIALVA